MSYLLFIDESGQDQRESPYEVLAGVAVSDRDLWNLICALHDAELRRFGTRYTVGENELKARKILKTKVFRHARSYRPGSEEEQRERARLCLEDGEAAKLPDFACLAHAKLAYVREAFEICARFRCRVFASIAARSAPRPAERDHLRKDYSYLFERFYYFLEDTDESEQGIVVFDELEKVKSHVLVDQMHRYFRHTGKGKLRSSRIVPEPFFVHSDLTTGVQLADLAAYVIAWGFRRITRMTAPARAELEPFADQVAALRYTAVRHRMNNPKFRVSSFAWIADLRGREERQR